jgi:hypothetical protein
VFVCIQKRKERPYFLCLCVLKVLNEFSKKKKKTATNMWPTEGRMETNRTAILRPTSTAGIPHFRHGSRMCRERALYASAIRPNVKVNKLLSPISFS